MACGCSKSNTYTESSPLVIGEDNQEAPQHYRTTVSLMGLRVNTDFWATGTGVAAMAGARWIVPA